jgi:hypothetical protein
MLRQILENTIPNYKELSVDEIVNTLNAESVVIENHEKITWAGVAIVMGPENAERLLVALRASGLEWANLQLGGQGIDIAHPLVQGMLTNFENAQQPGVTELKAYGVRYVSPYVYNGGTGMVTAEQITNLLLETELDDKRTAMRAKGASEYNKFIDAVAAWNGEDDEPRLVGFNT